MTPRDCTNKTGETSMYAIIALYIDDESSLY